MFLNLFSDFLISFKTLFKSRLKSDLSEDALLLTEQLDEDQHKNKNNAFI